MVQASQSREQMDTGSQLWLHGHYWLKSQDWSSLLWHRRNISHCCEKGNDRAT